MAEVTSLTADKIMDLVGNWQGVLDAQAVLDGRITQLNSDWAGAQVALDDLNNTVLPQFQAELSANNVAVSDLVDTVLPNLQTTLDANVAALNDLNTVDLPALNASLAANSEWIVDFNEVQIPALQAQLDANAAAINSLDLTGLHAQLDANTASINDLNTTTLPALDTRITNAQNAVDAIDISGLQTDLNAAEANVATLQGKFPITAPDISAGAVTANAISADAVTAVKIAAGAIIAGKIAAGAVTATEIAADAVTATQILAGSVTAAAIAADAVTAAKIAAGAIVAGKIAADAVTATEIAAGSVTASEIATDAVTAVKVQAGAIVAGKIAADAVTANEIAAGSVNASEINTGAVTTAKIFAGAVTATEIATDAVTANKIFAGAVVAGKIATDAVTAVTIKAGEVVAGKLATDSVLAASVKAGEIVAGKLATDAVLANNIKAGEIVAGKLATNAVTAANIQAGAVTTSKLTVGGLGGELILNGSFAEDFASSGWSSGGPLAYREANSNAPGGYQAVISSVSGSYNVLQSPMFPVAYGVNYAVNLQAAYVGTVPNGMLVRIVWYDSNKTYLGSYSDATFSVGTGANQFGASASQLWPLTRTFTPISTARYAQVEFYNYPPVASASNSYIRLSGISVRQQIEGNLLVNGAIDGKTITGATVQTAADVAGTQRIKIRNDGNGGIIEMYSGVANETAPTKIDPQQQGGFPYLQIISGTTTVYPVKASMTLNPGSAAGTGALTVTAGVEKFQSDAGANRLIMDNTSARFYQALEVTTGGITVTGSGSTSGGFTANNSGSGAGLQDATWNGGGLSGASINNSARVVRTSTIKMKKNVRKMTREEAHSVLGVTSYTGEMKQGPWDRFPDPRRYPMFVAEQAARAGAELWVARQHKLVKDNQGRLKDIIRDKQGPIHAFRTAEMTVAHNYLIKELFEELESLKQEISELKAA